MANSQISKVKFDIIDFIDINGLLSTLLAGTLVFSIICTTSYLSYINVNLLKLINISDYFSFSVIFLLPYFYSFIIIMFGIWFSMQSSQFIFLRSLPLHPYYSKERSKTLTSQNGSTSQTNTTTFFRAIAEISDDDISDAKKIIRNRDIILKPDGTKFSLVRRKRSRADYFYIIALIFFIPYVQFIYLISEGFPWIVFSLIVKYAAVLMFSVFLISDIRAYIVLNDGNIKIANQFNRLPENSRKLYWNLADSVKEKNKNVINVTFVVIFLLGLVELGGRQGEMVAFSDIEEIIISPDISAYKSIDDYKFNADSTVREADFNVLRQIDKGVILFDRNSAEVVFFGEEGRFYLKFSSSISKILAESEKKETLIKKSYFCLHKRGLPFQLNIPYLLNIEPQCKKSLYKTYRATFEPVNQIDDEKLNLERK
ncbi:MAG: hypothetical protein AAFW83_10920 [Pseudomonadota bacterium]